MTRRRNAGARVFTLAVAVALLCSGCAGDRETEDASRDQRELVVVSYGGAYQEAQRRAFFEPFAEQYGVTVREETWNGDFAALRSMVESGDVSWDVVAAEDYMVLRGAEDGLLERIDYSRVPETTSSRDIAPVAGPCARRGSRPGLQPATR